MTTRTAWSELSYTSYVEPGPSFALAFEVANRVEPHPFEVLPAPLHRD